MLMLEETGDYLMNTTVHIAVIIATLMLILAPMAGAKFAYDKDEGTVADILLESIWFYASVAAIYPAILVISGLTW